MAVTTGFAFAQQGQWPPRYGSYDDANANYIQSNQYSFQQAGSYRSGWQNNYVSPNYNPYQKQYRNQVTLPTGYNYLPTSPLFPLYRNPVLMPPSIMTYNPWLQGYGAMPLQYLPGWTY